MSARNLSYRNSYMEPTLTDDESSESMTSYIDDLDMRRKGRDRRDSAGRSLSSRQSLKSSPQRSFDDDSEVFARRSYRQSARERRASSSTRSMSSRSERRPSQRIRSDSTQDSETELGTRALVQAKIREKVAQASSMDESSSDLWKPKSTLPTKTEKSAPAPAALPAPNVSSAPVAPSTCKTTAQKTTKPVDRRKSVEKIIKPKVSIEPMTSKPVTKVVKPLAKAKTQPFEPPKTEPEPTEADLNNIPDIAPEGPPKTPDYDWTCEYCTFVNEPNVKICAVCCKTPSKNAIRKQASPAKEKNTPVNGKINDSMDVSKEGRTKKISRKISFWPGTKQPK